MSQRKPFTAAKRTATIVKSLASALLPQHVPSPLYPLTNTLPLTPPFTREALSPPLSPSLLCTRSQHSLNVCGLLVSAKTKPVFQTCSSPLLPPHHLGKRADRSKGAELWARIGAGEGKSPSIGDTLLRRGGAGRGWAGAARECSRGIFVAEERLFQQLAYCTSLHERTCRDVELVKGCGPPSAGGQPIGRGVALAGCRIRCWGLPRWSIIIAALSFSQRCALPGQPRSRAQPRRVPSSLPAECLARPRGVAVAGQG